METCEKHILEHAKSLPWYRENTCHWNTIRCQTGAFTCYLVEAIVDASSLTYFSNISCGMKVVTSKTIYLGRFAEDRRMKGGV